MKGGGRISLDADEALKLIDNLRKDLDDLSSFLAKGMTTKPPAIAPARQREVEKASEGQPFELVDFNIDAIVWKIKDGSPAGHNEGWAWGFSTDREGYLLPEAVELVQACEQYGEVQVGPYLFKIGGRDGNLLNRRLKK